MKYLSKLTISLIFLAFFCSLTFIDCAHPENSQSNKRTLQKIEEYIQQTKTSFDIPGIAAAVTKNGEIFYIDAFGVKNLSTQEQLRPEHTFHMASVSKLFVATAVIQLVEEGKIELDNPLTSYLPYFRMDDERYGEITVRQMLNHTSGIPDVIDYEWDNPQYDEGAAERYVRSLENEKLIASPGERFQYSNMAYDILGDVIAKVSGKPFEVYMKESILNPIGMKESDFLLKNIKTELRTSPHIWESEIVVSDTYPYNRIHAPSGTLNSSVIEMLRWAELNLNQGELDGIRLLKKESYNLLWQPSVQLSEKTSIGLGWMLSERHGLKTVSHSGDDLGFCCDFKLIPEKGIGIIMASNYMSAPISLMLDGVLDIVLGFEPEIPKKSIALYFKRIMEKDGIEMAKEAYHKSYVETRNDYDFGPQALNSLGYKYIRNQEIEKAIKVFLFNAELFPDNSNVYDSLAEALITKGDTDNALLNYKKSLELNPDNTNAREMIDKLEEKK